MCAAVFRGHSFPHARGDGPLLERLQSLGRWFSPRTWGWSAWVGGNAQIYGVFPTHVGMVRVSGKNFGAALCFPHARGDGPLTEVLA